MHVYSHSRTLTIFLPWLIVPCLFGQQPLIQGRITKNLTVSLKGHSPAPARIEFDRGAVAPSFELPNLVLHLKASVAQQTALNQLVAEQQDPASPNYHKWLTPEQYGDRFGASQSDIDAITAWLTSEGFTIRHIATSRTSIAFSGAAQQVESTFRTSIHRYQVNGQSHYANSSTPQIPAALADIVASIRGLHDFRAKSALKKVSPDMTSASGAHHIAPDDLATIYNFASLLNAGIDGTGQKIGIIGQTAIRTTDLTRFRSSFNLPALNLQQVLVPGETDPGVNSDLDEADLDIEWSGAVARNATIIYVYSNDVFTSLFDAVDNNRSPVLSISYGICEGMDYYDIPTVQAYAIQANVQGQTILASSGDTGAGGCEDANLSIAQNGLAVGLPSSVPEVTGVGGSEFNEAGGSYWNSSNTANQASATGYIPEKVWNDTAVDGSFSAGSGGSSLVFAKPAWQVGNGVPGSNFRHVPDVSLSASASHVGYYVYTGGGSAYYGGTSAGTPAIAGMIALLNQYLVSTKALTQPGVGNINPTLYRLAQTAPSVFHDITVGDNTVPCAAGTPDCVNGSFGFAAAPGYDRATGLGSLDAFNLVHQWTTAAPVNSAVVFSIDQIPVFQLPKPDRSGNNWTFVITLSEEAGIATTINSLTIDGKTFDVAGTFGSASIPAGGALTSKTLGLATLSAGTLTAPKSIAFTVTGTDAGGRQWSQQFSAQFAGVQVPINLAGASNAASGVQSYAPGMILSIYGASMGNFVQAASTIPLPTYMAGFEASIDGIYVPLYYVSPNQVNVQIPYEVSSGSVDVVIGNPWDNSNAFKINIVPAAPGIFQSNGFVVPVSTVKAGQTTTLYVTGQGAVRPSVATGDSPGAGTPPAPRLPVSMTVGGQPVTAVQFIGIPSWSVGVLQINYTVPASVSPGIQPVIVTVGGVASAPANITVTQ